MSATNEHVCTTLREYLAEMVKRKALGRPLKVDDSALARRCGFKDTKFRVGYYVGLGAMKACQPHEIAVEAQALGMDPVSLLERLRTPEGRTQILRGG